MHDIASKIMTLDEAVEWSKCVQAQGLRLVVTNGVFDLLHHGHVQYLHSARMQGDKMLVAINSDKAVKALKGESRPVVKEYDRAFTLAGMECVDAVVIFDTVKPLDVFRRIRPDIYAKGGDYNEDTLDRDEYAILKQQGAKFCFVPLVPGFSTTNTIRSLKNGTTTTANAEQKSTLDPRLMFLFSRRSVRAFQPRPIGDELLRTLLQGAMSAPSACCRDPWRFHVLKTDEIRKRVADCLPNGHFIAKAPTGLVACGDITAAHAGEMGYLLEDVAAATENLLLAANAFSLGSCWLGIYPRKDRVEAIQTVLGLPKNIIPVCAIALGYPAQEFDARSRFDETKITWD